MQAFAGRALVLSAATISGVVRSKHLGKPLQSPFKSPLITYIFLGLCSEWGGAGARGRAAADG